ncbi:FAD-dependent monooxygenase [Chromobacterium subtsugae]|uniref:FAD-dependent monooxygenase n=2 Tax=Chromobacterium subtsugae TaxID=251747 RepID=A0ABS7FI44_9NEIS|nr:MULTISPECIES: FAD-dependent oxidoreductase [Chromobacterium]KUM05614.1 2-octaprenyl-3-methyl-6-methoxy-1,4-benzoquinol hydroxylase [Chromobacterium subtsugae]KZE85368.1 2-octaprenyl-3-methyl-6-methoxy-1,4-benzoquinol hydroxylase [Chromobacterium sp. F49]MBW7568791.1 FAD-dependent monooxygenase [Chromobacterium subtsugae]MBW8289732.1 FAD-dependent monooxygenase [Chromobacterium subtsugae]WSE90941.1 FAD-dependent oxidoreductase [Chromobacterium subtsugae]
MEHRDIVIVGGGMVGSALAAALAGNGLSICVLEREAPAPFDPAQDPDLRVSAISPASARFLAGIGAWDKVLAMRAAPYRRMQVWEGEENRAALFDAAEADVEQLGHIVENRVAQLAATAALRDKGDVDYRCPAAVSGIVYRPQATQLTLSDGSQLQARLVVAADGARSLVREAAGIGITGWDYPMHALVLACRTDGGQQDITWQRFTPDGPQAFLPLCGDAASLVWYHRPEEVKRLLALPEAELIAAVAQAFPRKLPGIVRIAARGSFPLTRRHAQRYVRDGVALAGDAAHTIHPLAGQGVNLGFQDAAALADVILSARGQGEDWAAAAALARYTRARKPANLAMQAGMDAFCYGFSNDIAPLRLLRGLGLRLADKAGPLKRGAIRYALGLGPLRR